MIVSNLNENAFDGRMIDLNVKEIDAVAGGGFWVAAGILVGGAAVSAVVGEAAVGFVNGLIKGFQDDE
jgi:hypothetical protein